MTQPTTRTAAEDIVGRAAELDELVAALGAGGVVELVGEAGIGKTRLWQEARALTAATRPWSVVRAEPHEATTPYAPFARFLRRAAAIDVKAERCRRRPPPDPACHHRGA